MGNSNNDELGAEGADVNGGGSEQLTDIWHQSDNETREQVIRLLTQMAYNRIVSHIKNNDDPVDGE